MVVWQVANFLNFKYQNMKFYHSTLFGVKSICELGNHVVNLFQPMGCKDLGEGPIGTRKYIGPFLKCLSASSDPFGRNQIIRFV